MYSFIKMREARFWPAPQMQGKDKKFQFALKIGWRALAEGESRWQSHRGSSTKSGPTASFPNRRRAWESFVRLPRHYVPRNDNYKTCLCYHFNHDNRSHRRRVCRAGFRRGICQIRQYRLGHKP